MHELISEEMQSSIAIIGMSGRFPGARNIEEFWQNLRQGKESIHFFDPKREKKIPAMGILENMAEFDAAFFEMTPREAEITDPQQRLFLETAYEALEQAGYDPEKYSGRIGVYAGSGQSGYLAHVHSHPAIVDSVGSFQIMLATQPDFLSTRVSYKLDLKGPSIAVQTACSSSLVSVHMACQSLLTYECDMALAGGVSVKADQSNDLEFQEGSILSPDGHCRAFDSNAQGTVIGNGVGVVLLKRLEDALADNDHILAVVKGTAVNNDGKQKVGFTAPSITHQAEVIKEALSIADINPETISYIEAHGTGTTLGDPIEIAALTEAYREHTSKTGYCAIGSVKTNIGHLDNASGVTGLIKTVLALSHKQIPPSLHFVEANRQIDFEQSPFYVNTQLTEWKTGDYPLRAGVSSFGIGGTNAHVILEEAPVPAKREAVSPSEWNVLPLSAKTPTALMQAKENLAAFFDKNPEVDLGDVAYTLQARRKEFTYRSAVIARETTSAKMLLQNEFIPFAHYQGTSGELIVEGKVVQSPSVVFMFSGQGSQYVNMGRELYETEKIFRETVDYCALQVTKQIGIDIRELMYPAKELEEQAKEQLHQTIYAQPALFIIEYALAKLLESWGVRPHAMIGHSIGEYVAACLAGVLSLEDALSLVSTRGVLMQKMEKGAMLAVALGDLQVRELLQEHGGELSIAAVNSPISTVIAGTDADICSLEKLMEDKGITSKRLITSHAYHSMMMEPMLEEFYEALQQRTFHEPLIPYISNLTGEKITASQATDPLYWQKHLRETVHFSTGVRTLMAEPNCIFIEVGPGRSLVSLVRQHRETQQAITFTTLPSAKKEHSDVASLRLTVAGLWCHGVEMDQSALGNHENARRVHLPTYPFERKSYFLEKKEHPASSHAETFDRKRREMADWFYIPVWNQSSKAYSIEDAENFSTSQRWLIFQDEQGLGKQVGEYAERLGFEIATVVPDRTFSKIGENAYTVNIMSEESYEELFKTLDTQNSLPDKIIHMWSIQHTDEQESKQGDEHLEHYSLYSMLYIAKQLGIYAFQQKMEIIAMSNNLQEISNEEIHLPVRSTILGPLRVLAQEYPQVTTRYIDVQLTDMLPHKSDRLLKNVLDEILSTPSDFMVAIRGTHRFVQKFKQTRLPEKKSHSYSPSFRDKGIYLITGATQEIGLSVSEEIASSVNASLILIGDPDFPAMEHWDSYLQANDANDEIASKIKRIRLLKQNCEQLRYYSANLTDEEEMRQVIRSAENSAGRITGVVYAAERFSSGFIPLKSKDSCYQNIAQQVYGPLVLEKLIDHMNIEFMLLFSRTFSLTGGVGQMDNCVANVFLDTFARYQTAKGIPTIAINWGMWKNDNWIHSQTGMPLEMQLHMEQLQEKYGITAKEGTQVMNRILTSDYSQVIVSTQDIHSAIQEFSQYDILQSSTPSHRANEHLKQAADKYVAPRDETERKIADIWQDLFGISAISTQANFFELGGNSLLSIQLVTRLRNTFYNDIPMDILFQNPTIVELAQAITMSQIGQEEMDEIERMLSEIEKMSPEELSLKLVNEV
ncbi:type I polyketide synthase [Brevibacillus laterosporus]|uniref:type I polyketide synthase n=1 Tax=Brevibacillus laterosporus TaxID=1465 RepID=UPI00264B1B64|nr:type I polyketide synthase [Brevibacillus laterosporus]MDN9011592.1 beta-ketoacyl synthase N-terminal-like domain-containing protein [Brevibacillus laterosporus]MDO0942585.1 beta-ketoacyl synthase N-terminal-like domain-containing protein [Brevibacillus laterosporus]